MVPSLSAASAAEAPPLEPVSEVLRYPQPRAGVDPDPAKGWLRRLLPVVLAHPALLAAAVAASFISMLTSVAAPAVLGLAIDDALREGTAAPSAARGVLIG